MKEFNYAVGYYWKAGDGAIACYMYHNSEVHFGTLKEAKKHLEYCKRMNPDKDYKIFVVTELPEEL